MTMPSPRAFQAWTSGLESMSHEDLLALLVVQQRQIEGLKVVLRLSDEVAERPPSPDRWGSLPSRSVL
ncbi:MAG: hypothetical protein ACJ786_19785 [Catenulispora sp.]